MCKKLSISCCRRDASALDMTFESISEDLKKIREGQSRAGQVIMVVPAQFTLEAEEEAFRYFGCKGFFDFHIMSGSKLVRNIMAETGGPGTAAVNGLGVSMLLRKIAGERREDLQAFGKVAEDADFLKMAAEFIAELKQSAIGEEKLNELILKVADGSLLKKKLQDMKLIYSLYAKVAEGKFSDSEDGIRFASSRVKESATVGKSLFRYCGFHSFKPIELDFLKEILKYGAGLGVTLTMGRSEDADEDIFRESVLSLKALREMAEAMDIPVSLLYAKEGAFSRELPADIAHLERNLFALPPAVFWGKTENIKLVRCSGPFTQAETIALEILQLVRDEGFKYEEIAVLTDDMEKQGAVIKRVCAQLGVPLFADEKRAVSHSPAVETAAALLEFAAGGRHASRLLRCLKPGFIKLAAMESPEDMEEFENYCKQFHIRGERIFRPFRYGKELYEGSFERLEAMRAEFAELMEGFSSSMESASTAEEKCRVFYNFLAKELDIPGKLEAQALALGEELMLDASEEASQIWSAICGLLDQCVLLLGSEVMSLEDYAGLITDSFADIRLGLLPQARGKVLLGTLSRSLAAGCKALFVAGVNEGVIPKISGGEAILTQREMDELAEMGCRLCISQEVLGRENNLSIYSAFTTPSRRLWLGYCAAGGEGEEMKPSPLISHIKTMFPGLKEDADAENSEDSLAFVQGQKAAASRAGRLMREAVAEGKMPEALWKQVYNGLHSRDAIREGLLFFNSEGNLDPEDAAALYSPGGAYSLSPSRLENFARCPFKHFVSYGLRPRELKDFSISPVEVGNLYHAVLMEIARWLADGAEEKGVPITHEDSPWMSVSEDEIKTRTAEIIQRLQREDEHGVMAAGPEESYRAGRIGGVCARFALNMVEQVRKGIISSMFFESRFGRGGDFPALEMETPFGKVFLEGKIDRVDIIGGGEKKYVKIIDYKSGSESFDRSLAEKGLMLQLGIYMEGALGKGGLRPAGMFYYNIKDPDLTSELASAGDAAAEILWENLRREYRMNGFFVEDPAVIESIDAGIGPGESSSVINYSISKAGIARGGGTGAEDFEKFRKDFRAKLAELCGRLAAGELDIAPRKVKNKLDACAYCDYRGICAFDSAFPENRHRSK